MFQLGEEVKIDLAKLPNFRHLGKAFVHRLPGLDQVIGVRFAQYKYQNHDNDYHAFYTKDVKKINKKRNLPSWW